MSHRMEWKRIESSQVRDSYTGEPWSVEVWAPFQDNGRRADGLEVRSVCAAGDVHSVAPTRSLAAARKLVRQRLVAIGGRRLEGRWVLCGSDTTVPGWDSVPWPGPVAGDRLGRMPQGAPCR